MQRIAIGILITVLVLVLAFVVAGLILPNDLRVKVDRTIEAPLDLTYAAAADVRQWANWTAWAEMDPDTIYTFGETTVGEGASYAWSGEKSGSGELQIISATPDESLSYVTLFEGFEETPGVGTLTFTTADTGTRVTWTFESDMGTGPRAGWMTLLIGFFLPSQFERGLERLEDHVRSQMVLDLAPEAELSGTS
jgi:uncharacterized protein YndB with AHSA1/START domain